MESQRHPMTHLFAQLGLPSTPADIQAFLASRRLPTEVALADAPFWTPAQAGFLREAVEEDADWAGIIDRLDSGLRGRD